jgi:Skp family chaperone for outer membrane proteins
MTSTKPLLRYVAITAVAVAASVFGVVALQQPAVATSAMQPAGSSVGVVDFDALMGRSDYAKSLQTQLNESRQSAQEQLQAQANQLQEEIRQIDANLERGTDQYREKRTELIIRQAELEARRQLAQAQAIEAARDANIELFSFVEQAVQQVAQERGLGVVLRKNLRGLPEDTNLLRGVELNDLETLIRGQTVLYVDPSIDITGEVQTKLDVIAAAG